MSRCRAVCRLFLFLGLAAAVLAGCSASSPSSRMTAPGRKVAPGKEYTRRGVEREFISSPAFGSARGRAFEDLIPVGARISAVHLSYGDGIEGIQLSYERNGIERETPLRGASNGKTDVFKLARNEKILGIDAWGEGTIEGLTIVSNKQTRTFGAPPPETARSSTSPLAALTREDRERRVAIGITGRADTTLHQLSLRIQVRSQG